MTENAPVNAPEAIITIKNKALARIWGVSEAHASTIGRPAHLPGIKDGGIWLQRAVQMRPIVILEDEFEAILAVDSASMDGDPVEIARAQGLWTWHYSSNPSRDLRGLKATGHNKQQIEAESAALAHKIRADEVAGKIDADRAQIEAAVASMPDATSRNIAGDMLATARLAKLNADIERANMRTRKEAGELIERSEVQFGITAAGAIVRTTLENLPHDLADLVPLEMRGEVRLKAEKAIERVLHAISKAMVLEDEDE